MKVHSAATRLEETEKVGRLLEMGEAGEDARPRARRNRGKSARSDYSKTEGNIRVDPPLRRMTTFEAS